MNQNYPLTWNDKEWDEYFKNDDSFAFQFIITLPRYELQVSLSWFRRLVPKYQKECVLPTSDSVQAYSEQQKLHICVPIGCLRALKFRKTHPYSIKDPSVQRWETHRDPSVQSLSSKHFHFLAIFTDKKGRGFTGMTPCLCDMLIHTLTHLFNAVGQIVCLKLIPKAPDFIYAIIIWHIYVIYVCVICKSHHINPYSDGMQCHTSDAVTKMYVYSTPYLLIPLRALTPL